MVDHRHHHWPSLSQLPSATNHHHIHHHQFIVTLFSNFVVACCLCNCFCHHCCSILSSTWLLLLLLLLRCTTPQQFQNSKSLTKIIVQQRTWFHVHCTYNCMSRTLYPTKVHMIPINNFCHTNEYNSLHQNDLCHFEFVGSRSYSKSMDCHRDPTKVARWFSSLICRILYPTNLEVLELHM